MFRGKSILGAQFSITVLLHTHVSQLVVRLIADDSLVIITEDLKLWIIYFSYELGWL